MAAERAITTLGYALLGLTKIEPQTGYAVRKIFETTPMGNYSSSPGSIYPALKNLENGGLIQSEAAGARKAILSITPAGRKALEKWLTGPVTGDDIAKRMDDVMLRFALLNDYGDRWATLDFLTSFLSAAEGQVSGLKAFMVTEVFRNMPLQARLAVEHGLRVTQASAGWAADAYYKLEGER